MDQSFSQKDVESIAAYYNSLDIQSFTLMLKDPSYCYKFYWLEAIVNLISEDVQQTTFDGIINEMICNAWYSVREFHIHLSGLGMNGEVKDGLERTILRLSDLSALPSNASKVEINNAIGTYEMELVQFKKQLTNMVPFRALSGFFATAGVTLKESEWNSPKKMKGIIDSFSGSVTSLPYVLGPESGLFRTVYFNPEWMGMIQEYTAQILGWIQFEKVKWLQNNNPEVPGLVYKLLPMDDKMRKLGKVRKLWEGVLSVQKIPDVFTGKVITSGYDIDHFIPWSFIMNDELWNLMPMDSSLNSSKSNKLPEWERFYRRFSDNQYVLYQMIQKKPEIHRLFEACWRDNLHSIWAGQELYRPGNSKEMFDTILMKNMKPVYDSARRQGYEIWKI